MPGPFILALPARAKLPNLFAKIRLLYDSGINCLAWLFLAGPRSDGKLFSPRSVKREVIINREAREKKPAAGVAARSVTAFEVALPCAWRGGNGMGWWVMGLGWRRPPCREGVIHQAMLYEHQPPGPLARQDPLHLLYAWNMGGQSRV